MSCKSGKSGKDPSPVLVSNLHQVNPDKGQVQVEGYRKLRDGGEGMFYWRQTRQPLNDGGMYVASSVRNNGMWVRHVGKVIQSRHYGLPLGMDEDVSQRVQAMITAADRERIPEIFFSKGVYVLNTVTMGPGIHFRGEEGSILKKKARAKKFDRMFTTQGLRYYGKEDSPAIRFSNLVFDGSLDAQGPYQNYEL
ncbi:MAG: hypothetical protein KTR24_08965, partial [Saprospiraceae bacterium]|nr:hypothetical protein [Saprospiraceae bacterium]